MKEIKKLVKEILTENDMYTIPVNVVQLSKKLGFTVLQQEIDGDGIILVNKDGFVIDDKPYTKAIVVNINHNASRKRFTIAHELGHWFDCGKDSAKELYANRDDSKTMHNNEPEMNNFASELLMPEELVINFLNAAKRFEFSDNALISQFATLFNVSYSAAEIRLRKLSRSMY